MRNKPRGDSGDHVDPRDLKEAKKLTLPERPAILSVPHKVFCESSLMLAEKNFVIKVLAP